MLYFNYNYWLLADINFHQTVVDDTITIAVVVTIITIVVMLLPLLLLSL